MDKFELFKLCLIKYDEFRQQKEKKKWFYKVYNRFALINLEEGNYDLFKIHIVDYKSIYSFLIIPGEDVTDYMDPYKKEDIVQVTIRENNNAIKFSGVTGMSAFVDTDNLHRIPVVGQYQCGRNNRPFWKTLFAKY